TNLLRKGSNKRTTESRLRAAVVNDLNKLIQDKADFSWKEDLPKETLSRRSQELLNRGLTGNPLIRLKRSLLEEAYPNQLTRSIFPPPERVVPQRIRDLREAQPAHRNVNAELAPDVLNAGRDPVHHLRLFANYLTPRKGALSADTWRAITFISRNLILTWLILAPILISAILLGQLYFLFQPDVPQRYSALWDFLDIPEPSIRQVLLSRLVFAVW